MSCFVSRLYVYGDEVHYVHILSYLGLLIDHAACCPLYCLLMVLIARCQSISGGHASETDLI